MVDLKREFYFIRHGETEFNRQGIIQGMGIDTSLNDRGRAQADAFFSAYQTIPFELVVTSSLRRTKETVQPFLGNGMPVVEMPLINEISWGIFEGKKSTPELHRMYLEVVEGWKRGDLELKVEGGESASELSARLTEFLFWIENRTERYTLICSHGRAMRCLMCLISGIEVSNMYIFAHSNTGLYKVVQNNHGYHLVRKNDIAHINAMI